MYVGLHEVIDFSKALEAGEMNAKHTTLVVKADAVTDKVKELNSFPLENGTKNRLRKSATELAHILNEVGYTVSASLVTNTVWELEKANRISGTNLTAYYFDEALPLFVTDGKTYVMIAPWIIKRD